MERSGRGAPVHGLGGVERRDAEVVTVPDGFERWDTGGRCPTYPHRGSSAVIRHVSATCRREPSRLLAVYGADPTMDRIQVKKDTKPIIDRIPDVGR